MSTPNTIPELTPPKCPHCDAPLPGLGCYAWKIGGYTIICNHCPTCMVALHFEVFLSPAQPEADPGDPPQPKSPLWKPS